MRNRVLAVVAAVTLVVGAVLLRGVLADDGDGDDDVIATDTTTAAPRPGGPIVCIEELREVCQTLDGEVVIEPAADTVDRLSATDSADDIPAAWVTYGPFPAIVDENRGRNGLEPLFTTNELAGTSPLVFVARKDRGEALVATCGGEVTWTCLGDNAGRSWADLGGDARWGSLKPSHDAPDRSARGAVVFAAAVASWFGNPDVTRNDFDNDDFVDWATNLERAIPSFGSDTESPLERFVIVPATFDVVATTAVEANALAGPDTSRGAGFTIYPSPMGEAQAVVAGTGALPDLATDVRAALAGAGWDPAEGDAPALVPGLPVPGVVEALRTDFWEEIR